MHCVLKFVIVLNKLIILQQKCATCGDEFEVDFNEDTDQWEYQNCVKYEGKNFHPQCLEDFKNGGGLFQVCLYY